MTTLALQSKSQPFEFPFLRAGWKACLSLGLCLLGLLVYGSLWQNIKVVSSIYQLQQLQNKLAELKKENESLRANSLGGTSLENLEKLVSGLNLEKVDRVQFISPLGNVVVSR